MPVRRVTPEEAVHLLAHDDVELLDVREPHEWATGHIPGARHLPLGFLLRDPARGLRSGQDRVLFVCEHGIRSLTAAAAASQAGCDRAYSLDGGVEAWAAAGLPIEPG